LPTPLTYVVEDEVMKITTVEKANEKLTIRMYPVGDLVLGPDQLRALSRTSGAMGSGAGQGGQGGGLGGGQGGAQGGGIGGGGVGGGMFSVPSEVFPPQAQASEKAASSSFTNESVQSSKKKRSDAR
jgi:hypothetical protein